MIQFNDQDIQVFLNKEEIKEPQLQCGGRNKVTKFCISNTCQSQALCCEEQACETCPKRHMRCAFQMLADLTKRVKKRIELQKDIIQRFYIMEMEIINDIYQHRRDYLSSENFWETTGQLPDIIKKIYLKPGINIKNVKGAEIGKSFMELLSCTEYIRNSADYLIGWYSKQGKQLIHKFIQTKFDNIDNSFENIRETIDSKILEQDNMGRKKLEFILKQLNNPRKITLLFRASKIPQALRQLKSYTYHHPHQLRQDYCGIYSFEMGRIRTEILSSQQSFLLQLDLMVKMKYNKGSLNCNAAITDRKEYGPSFGGNVYHWNNPEADLLIANQCNKPESCQTNFPKSFQCIDNKRTKQQIRQSLCGADRFHVIEYEVFKVQFA